MTINKKIELDIYYETYGVIEKTTIKQNVEIEISADEIIFAIKQGDFDGRLYTMRNVINQRALDRYFSKD
ncbi:MAG: hypothetical protein LBD17_02710 [Endomicrobium sp.]|jgi:hypothetical protein|nr:hypothetical protein [Endomicrobium sp.]